ncbi:AAA family ATPase [Bacillus wiedmannii]|uniref:AAA family ATPase n=1 Tax=Bacillus wiedmannii TaxID=1890302 RepID=UPI0024AE325B|nr:AAA family ATPase [Bacillus wiedmannii]MDI6504852.1 AAA family ATPase [Bacillus wiedmannii]MDI6510753.1 AAA family ATPase [Bacillus wiedmannii]
MKFYETSHKGAMLELGVYLVKDGWNDFGYYTLYKMFYVDKLKKHEIGYVKIGMSNEEKNDSTFLPSNFEQLNDSYFSLGQGNEYYKRLNTFGPEVRDSILKALNDIAYDLDLFEKVKNYNITKTSFLREFKAFTVKDQFHRLAKGGIPLTPYQFDYEYMQKDCDPVIFNFNVKPDSMPPTNIHALIGSNGVGKTTIINNMIQSIIGETVCEDNDSCFYDTKTRDTKNLFANSIFISFSAFDNTPYFQDVRDKENEIIYSYIGLKSVEKITNDENSNGSTEKFISKNPETLINEFIESIKRIKDTKDLWKLHKWKESISMLEIDPLFKIFGIKEIELKDIIELKRKYNKLSSGHKIILLTITKLIEKVDEKSLLVLDEPESHLHPPLLSAFIRALSDILISRNGVAIIATHSPVILQELPRSCVSIIKRRSNQSITVHRPEIETFGENVGTLTREVFGLEVTYSGFHKILDELVEKGKDYDQIIDLFNGELGLEARTILRSLLYYKE